MHLGIRRRSRTAAPTSNPYFSRCDAADRIFHAGLGTLPDEPPEEPAMHHSKLSVLVLDCQCDDLRAAAAFWSAAFGKPIAKVDMEGDGKYAELETADDELLMLLQKVDHPSRVHLDIETDDQEAEVTRLEKLGAKRIAYVRGRWWVMEAPTGHRFCVVHKQRKEFGPHLNRWD
jgi:predicted enzyme related to lactoylglutathione lyase